MIEKVVLIHLTGRNANHIIPSYCNCQSVAEVQLTSVAPSGVVNDRFYFNVIRKLLIRRCRTRKGTGISPLSSHRVRDCHRFLQSSEFICNAFSLSSRVNVASASVTERSPSSREEMEILKNSKSLAL